jgi:hypothetical protein
VVEILSTGWSSFEGADMRQDRLVNVATVAGTVVKEWSLMGYTVTATPNMVNSVRPVTGEIYTTYTLTLVGVRQ